jgi:ABC-type nitrate/sulfonate/bicarbonate transport system permease component
MRNWYRGVAVTVSVVAVVTAWEAGARFGILSPLYLPAPSSILRAWRMQLGYGLAATTARAVCGFLSGLLLAYCIHFGSVTKGESGNLDAQFAGARAVPVIAILPLFIIWFGFREVGRLLIVTLSATAFFIAPLHESYRLLPRQWVMLREQIPLRPLGYYAQVVLPGTISSLAGAFRVTLALSFTMAIASEYIGAQAGVGKFLDSARITFNVPAILLAIVACSVMGICLDRLLLSSFRRLVPWAGKQPKL